MPNERQHSDEEDQKQNLINMKVEPERRQHVPYILNGELYRIESQNGDNVTVRCCYCPPDRIYRGSIRSTGNFHMHIKRRHVSLMGKLHEMKVAALLERRDQIAKNRRLAKCRKKSTSPVVASAPSPTPIATTTTHQLKIKKVFQRHKQEHHEQEEAAAIRSSISLCDSSQDNISQSSGNLSTSQTQDNNNNNTNNNENTIIKQMNNSQNLEDLKKPSDNSTIFENIQLTTVTENSTTLPRALNVNFIKPEQQQQAIVVQSEAAIDLSRSSSFQSDDMQSIEFTTAIQQSSGQELTTYLNGSRGGDVLLSIDNTLRNIKDELQARNQIEHKRLLFDVAKFKFQHPNFNFNLT
ncbi:protein stand still [Drosophila nasuta]|uniref:protein stand still n=1 Tax=Drosophila nasuta TaxID=42062 RepID=UPI00295E2918|nr:protein stand still [Drosophila nasuta]